MIANATRGIANACATQYEKQRHERGAGAYDGDTGRIRLPAAHSLKTQRASATRTQAYYDKPTIP
jgi:hypothetical protein